MLSWLFSLEGLSAFLICFATLMIFSFLYRDNPFYKFAEHVFVGTSAGYGIVLVGVQIIKPNLIDRLLPSINTVKQKLLLSGELAPGDYQDAVISLGTRLYHGEWIYYIFLILGLMMLLKITKKLHWLSRWPLAYVIGAFAGIQIIQATQGSLIPQLSATMKDFSGGATVELALNASGRPPEGELELRHVAMAGFWEGWFQTALPEQEAAELGRTLADTFELELRGLVPGTELESDPLAVMKQMRLELHRIVSRDMQLERLLCAELGGRPFVESLYLASQGENLQDPGILIPEEAADPRYLQTLLFEQGLEASCLDHLTLEGWQEALLVPMQRIWLESVPGRRALAERMEQVLPRRGRIAAEALARPAGRTSLTEAYKAEVFAPGANPDWSLPVTHRLADSLLNRVNSRPARFSEWSSSELVDLEQRISDGPADLASDLRARMAFFDGLAENERLAAEAAFLDFWSRGMVREWRDTRQAWLLESLSRFARAGWNQPFTREQRDELRANPGSYLPYDGSGLTVGALRRDMLIEILSNLLVVIGVCAGVFYFFFSKKHTGALGMVSKVGIAFLMMSFGASFGYTVMGRISLAIGRFQDLLNYPLMAGTALIVLIVALFLESRRKA